MQDNSGKPIPVNELSDTLMPFYQSVFARVRDWQAQGYDTAQINAGVLSLMSNFCSLLLAIAAKNGPNSHDFIDAALERGNEMIRTAAHAHLSIFERQGVPGERMQ